MRHEVDTGHCTIAFAYYFTTFFNIVVRRISRKVQVMYCTSRCVLIRILFGNKTLNPKHMGKLQSAVTLIQRRESTIPTIKFLDFIHSTCPYKNYVPKCSQFLHKLIIYFFFFYLVCNLLWFDHPCVILLYQNIVTFLGKILFNFANYCEIKSENTIFYNFNPFACLTKI